MIALKDQPTALKEDADISVEVTTDVASNGTQAVWFNRGAVASRAKKAALRFLKTAIGQQDRPVKVTIDQSGANTAALIALNANTDSKIEIRQLKYLNNVIEQDHQAIKRIVRPMLGLQTFRSTRITLQGIELMYRIKKGQMRNPQGWSAAQQFYSLAA